MTLKATLLLSPGHQAAFGATCEFLFWRMPQQRPRCSMSLEKKKILIMTKICVLSLLALSCFLTERGEKARYLGYMLQMNDMDKQRKREIQFLLAQDWEFLAIFLLKNFFKVFFSVIFWLWC